MGKFIWLAHMDIPPEHDALFNELYNNEHFPAFRKTVSPPPSNQVRGPAF